MIKSIPKPYVITVDMGYGHQRAAFPLRSLAYKKEILNANNYPGIPARDRKIWNQSRQAYEFFSRFKKTPLIGEVVWDIFDQFQRIEPFYPKRDLSKPSIQLQSTYSLIKRKAWGQHLIQKLTKNPRPLIATFFIPAFMAEIFNYPGEIYCLLTDTDVSRAWAPLNPRTSKIKYLAPNFRVAERLKMYGVPSANIFITGFPLPEDLVGGEQQTLVKKYLGPRLYNLDPQKVYLKKYKGAVCQYLGKANFPRRSTHPLTLMFAVGGAGAQRELGRDIIQSLEQKIKTNKLNLILVAGVHNDVGVYFKKAVAEAGLSACLKKQIRIIVSQSKKDYFQQFNKALRQTDILWTKPSELSFYTALGLPIIISEPIGSQEIFNQKWLRTIGSGIKQEDPRCAHQWLFDWLKSGWFAEAAMQGFTDATTQGVDNIKKIIKHQPTGLHPIKPILQY